MRQAAGVNQRRGGCNITHMLPICVLVPMLVWLLFQVKHYHDREKALEDSSLFILGRLEQSRPDFLKLRTRRASSQGIPEIDMGIPSSEAEEAEARESEREENDQDAGPDEGDEEEDEDGDEFADAEEKKGGAVVGARETGQGDDAGYEVGNLNKEEEQRRSGRRRRRSEEGSTPRRGVPTSSSEIHHITTSPESPVLRMGDETGRRESTGPPPGELLNISIR